LVCLVFSWMCQSDSMAVIAVVSGSTVVLSSTGLRIPMKCLTQKVPRHLDLASARRATAPAHCRPTGHLINFISQKLCKHSQLMARFLKPANSVAFGSAPDRIPIAPACLSDHRVGNRSRINLRRTVLMVGLGKVTVEFGAASRIRGQNAKPLGEQGAVHVSEKHQFAALPFQG
jgi:hypothetical protein